MAVDLNAVHAQIKARYIVDSQLAQDEADAKEIEKFLNQLNKEFINTQTSIDCKASFYSQIAVQLRESHPRLRNLFNVSSGRSFEIRMVEILRAVATQALREGGYDESIISSLTANIDTATQQGTTFNLEELSGKIAQSVLKELGARTQKKIQGDLENQVYYLPKVNRKTDAQMINMEINLIPGSETQRIYDLLKGATFSLKNYNTKLKDFARDWWSKGVKLGGANYMRSIGGTLKTLGYNVDEIVALLNRYNYKYKESKDIRMHYDHLAFIYELTGGGMQLENGQLEDVRFLICNDPGTGRISVTATRSLIKKMFDQNILIFEHINGKKIYSIRKTHLFG